MTSEQNDLIRRIAEEQARLDEAERQRVESLERLNTLQQALAKAEASMQVRRAASRFIPSMRRDLLRRWWEEPSPPAAAGEDAMAANLAGVGERDRKSVV